MIDDTHGPAGRHARALRPLVLLLAAALPALGACTPHAAFLRPYMPAERPRVNLCAAAVCPDSVELTYLGVGGFLVRHQGKVVLTAPSFTNRRLSKVLLPWPYRFVADTALVDERMMLADTAAMRTTAAILVGHAHYDHLLDVPYVARRWASRPPIYGSPTMMHILAGEPSVDSLAVAVADSVGDRNSMGRWIYASGGGIRFMPLASTHAPNLWRYTFSRGAAGERRSALPRTARGWRMGEVYAWIVDIVAPDSTPLFRIYYQDSAADSAHLELPRFAGRDDRQVDVAILCAANYGAVENNPDVAVTALTPRFVVLGHWEDFFRSPRDPLQVVRFTDTERLARRLDARMGDNWLTPEPMTRVTFRY